MLTLLKEIQQETGTEDDDEVLLTAHCLAPPAPLANSTTTPNSVDLRPLVPSTSALNGKVSSSRCFRQETVGTKSATVATTSNTTDDSSDISGYHSDSDTSPTSTQSPTNRNDVQPPTNCNFQSPVSRKYFSF